jgi:hypothetical protein
VRNFLSISQHVLEASFSSRNINGGGRFVRRRDNNVLSICFVSSSHTTSMVGQVLAALMDVSARSNRISHVFPKSIHFFAGYQIYSHLPAAALFRAALQPARNKQAAAHHPSDHRTPPGACANKHQAMAVQLTNRTKVEDDIFLIVYKRKSKHY